MQRPRHYRGKSVLNGFTLVEMLLVVVVIALLIAILLPVLGKSREAAREIGCRANLHAYGVGVVAYSLDNGGTVMKIVEHWGGRPYPNYIRRDSNASPAYAGEWSINLLTQYAKGLATDGNIFGIALCPSIDAALMQKFITVRNIGSNHPFLEFQYTYWGRSDRMATDELLGNAANELTRGKLRSDRLLISDILYWDQSDLAWRYNHGPSGWAFNEYSWMPWDRGAVPNISVVNQAMGDGSVQSKQKAQYPNIQLMRTPALYPDGGVGKVGQNGDTFYY